MSKNKSFSAGLFTKVIKNSIVQISTLTYQVSKEAAKQAKQATLQAKTDFVKGYNSVQ
jgi:hypothetical protein